jgi:hypothetical protein
VQFLALEAAIEDRRHVGIGQRGGEPGFDHVEGFYRPDIIILPMRPDEALRQPVQLHRIEAQRLGLVRAGKGWRQGGRRRGDLSACRIGGGDGQSACSQGLKGGTTRDINHVCKSCQTVRV